MCVSFGSRPSFTQASLQTSNKALRLHFLLYFSSIRKRDFFLAYWVCKNSCCIPKILNVKYFVLKKHLSYTKDLADVQVLNVHLGQKYEEQSRSASKISWNLSPSKNISWQSEYLILTHEWNLKKKKKKKFCGKQTIIIFDQHQEII